MGDEHLHIDPGDPLADWLGKALMSARGGGLQIDLEGRPAVRIQAASGKIAVDLLEPEIFRTPQDETGLFDKLKTASEFGRKLSDNGVTLSFMRKGKEAVRLGQGAKPTFSKMITRSGDVQLSSVREFAKLKGDLKTD